MLSYRHAYHAGNFADVMKHVVLTAILRYLTRKDAPLCYVDTHAGAGAYDLTSDFARKTAESDQGIARLWSSPTAPPAIADYLALVRAFNPGRALRRYPGSPALAAALLRPSDRLLLCEMHSSDFPRLERFFKGDRRVRCYSEDGYKASIGFLPPRERRGLVLMDPSYEQAREYAGAISTLAALHRRFATGTYALWYPILDERRPASLQRSLKNHPIRNVLHMALRIADEASHPGMYGSGMIVINPPWTLRSEMDEALPFLAQALGAGSAAEAVIEQWIDE